MKTTIDIPEPLYKKAKIRAIERGQTLREVVVGLLERELDSPQAGAGAPVSYWAKRKVLPEYAAAAKAGAFSGGTDSTRSISEERDAR